MAMIGQIRCSSCGDGVGVYHVTATVTVVSASGMKTKIVQFWLCEQCEAGSRKVLAADADQRMRVARRLTELPERNQYPAVSGFTLVRSRADGE